MVRTGTVSLATLTALAVIVSFTAQTRAVPAVGSANILYHLEADTLVGLKSDGQAVDLWPGVPGTFEARGSGFPIPEEPIFRADAWLGNPGVEFDDTNDRMSVFDGGVDTNIDGVQSFVIVARMDVAGASGNQQMWLGGEPATPS